MSLVLLTGAAGTIGSALRERLPRHGWQLRGFDRYAIRVACLRIGTFEPRPPHVRSLSTWLSADDCARLVDACLRAPDLEYTIVWGISANTRRTPSLAAGRALGYEPRDDAEVYAGQ